MNREQMVERAADAIRAAGDFGPFAPNDYARAEAAAVLDAVLPQVTTVDELEALPAETIGLTGHGEVWTTDGEGHWTEFSAGDGWWHVSNVALPLTVVWQPS